MTNTDDNSDIKEVQQLDEIEKNTIATTSATTPRATTTTTTPNDNNDNNNSDYSPSVPAATWQHAMNESLRSLPGAFHVTPTNLLNNPTNENGNVVGDDDESTTDRIRPMVLPEHDIAVEAYAVNDNDDNNRGNQRTAANNNQGGDNDVEYGQQRQPISSTNSNNNDVPIAQVVPTIFGIEKGRFKQISLFLGIILIIVIVVLSVVLTNNNKSNTPSPNPPVGTTSEDDDQSTIIIKNERRQKLINIISPLVKEGTFDQFLNNTHNNTEQGIINPTGNKYIYDRIATLEWLLQDLNSKEFDADIPNWKVQQRYVLALLYISTTSNNNIIGTQWGSSTSTTDDEEQEDEENNNNDWYQKYNFLSSKDECDWYFSKTICNTYPNVNLDPDNLEDCPKENLEHNVQTKGVSCDSEGRVTRISLYENNLIGELPPELSVLSEINKLDFVTNKISGNIPSSFGNMTKLVSLMLGNNCLEGSIPSELFDLNVGVSNYHLNSKLTGSLGGFCNDTKPRGDVNFIAADCGSCPYAFTADPATVDLFAAYDPNSVIELNSTGAGINYTASMAVFNVECDCCTCCDPISEMCCNSDGSFAFPAGVEKTECSL